MDVPWGTLAAVAVIWTVGPLAYSVAVAFVVARFAARPAWLALVVGLFLPVLGPWLWGLVEYGRAKRGGYRAGSDAWRPRVTLASYLWWVAGGLLCVSLFLPWVAVAATVEGKYDDSFQPTPLDTVVGGATLGVFAVALVLCGVYAGRWGARRQAVVLAGGATVLLLVAISSAYVYGEVAHAASSVATWTDRHVEGELTPGPALWLTAAAAGLALAGCFVAVAQAGGRVAAAAAPEAPPALEPAADPWSAGQAWGNAPETGTPSWDRSTTGGW
jgi:hypothetical protein